MADYLNESDSQDDWNSQGGAYSGSAGFTQATQQCETQGLDTGSYPHDDDMEDAVEQPWGRPVAAVFATTQLRCCAFLQRVLLLPATESKRVSCVFLN